jgi:hypothetical protein
MAFATKARPSEAPGIWEGAGSPASEGWTIAAHPIYARAYRPVSPVVACNREDHWRPSSFERDRVVPRGSRATPTPRGSREIDRRVAILHATGAPAWPKRSVRGSCARPGPENFHEHPPTRTLLAAQRLRERRASPEIDP